MKFKLTAGAELDLLTQAELDKALKNFARDWQVAAAAGPKSVDWWGTGTVDAAGGLTIGGDTANPVSGRFGPDVSMIWSVKRCNVRGLTGADALSLYVGEATPQRSVKDGISAYERFGSNELVLRGGRKLLFVGTGLTTAANTVITISGSAWELPQIMMYQLNKS
jgi:hypothetical protein